MWFENDNDENCQSTTPLDEGLTQTGFPTYIFTLFSEKNHVVRILCFRMIFTKECFRMNVPYKMHRAKYYS